MIMSGLNTQVAKQYLESLKTHIANVQIAGEKLGVPREQLEVHDQSKYSEEEFPHYANYFFGDKNASNFAKAWNHHIHNNPHHWQYWMFADGYTPENSNVENGVLPMPENYALEMIADWMGASKTYTDSWDMMDWLNEKYRNIKLHSQTRLFIDDVLRGLGYENIF